MKHNFSAVLDFKHTLGITNITTAFLYVYIYISTEKFSWSVLHGSAPFCVTSWVSIDFKVIKGSLTSIFSSVSSRLVLIFWLILVSSVPSVGWLSHSVHKSSNFLLFLLILKGSSQRICLLKSFRPVLFTLQFQTQHSSCQHSIRCHENWPQ